MMKKGTSMGDVQSTGPVPCALYPSVFEPYEGRRGDVFTISSILYQGIALNSGRDNTVGDASHRGKVPV